MAKLKQYILASLYSLLILPELAVAYDVYSNCYKSTNWTRNTGDQLRSWIGSIVPSASNQKKFISLTFQRNRESDGVINIISNGIRWERVGSYKIDGWMYGKIDEDMDFIDGQTYFIFPDFKTAIIGTFDEKKLVSGVETKVTHFRCSNGIMNIKFSKVKPNSPIYRYVDRNQNIFSDNHQLRDPLERKNVYIGSSTVIPEIAHQDALFARRDIPAYSLVSYYGGSFTNSSYLDTFGNLTIDKREDMHKNIMGFNQTHVIDIPPSMTSITKYRSTLGHKANHHFVGINTKYTRTVHPVYGQIMCLESTRYIKRGEEIIVSYNYNPHAPETPRWYKKLFEETHPNQKSNPARKCSPR